MRAVVDTFTMRFTKENFENMIEEYPEVKA